MKRSERQVPHFTCMVWFLYLLSSRLTKHTGMLHWILWTIQIVVGSVKCLKSGVYYILLLSAALLLFIWNTASNEFELCLWDTAKCQPTQNTFKHKLHLHSTTLCDITVQTHRVDWFSCLAFVLLQDMPAWLPILYFKLHVDGHKFHYQRPHRTVQPQVVHRCLRSVVLKPWPARPSGVTRKAIFMGKKT